MTSIISTICVVCIATPPFVVCLIPIGLFYLSQQRYFSKTYREIKRIDSVARSPVYALFSETLDGLTTVRAYSASNFLKRRIITLLDDQQIAYFLTFSSQCWLAVRLELAGTAIIAFACLASVFEFGLKGGGEDFAGFAGLNVSFALSGEEFMSLRAYIYIIYHISITLSDTNFELEFQDGFRSRS